MARKSTRFHIEVTSQEVSALLDRETGRISAAYWPNTDTVFTAVSCDIAELAQIDKFIARYRNPNLWVWGRMTQEELGNVCYGAAS